MKNKKLLSVAALIMCMFTQINSGATDFGTNSELSGTYKDQFFNSPTTNNGNLTVDNGIFRGSFTNNGELSIKKHSLSSHNALGITKNEKDFTNNGNMTLDGAAFVQSDDAALTNNGRLVIGRGATFLDGKIVNNGELVNEEIFGIGEAFNVPKDITGDYIDLSDVKGSNNSLENNGIFTNNGRFTALSDADVTNNGIMNNSSTGFMYKEGNDPHTSGDSYDFGKLMAFDITNNGLINNEGDMAINQKEGSTGHINNKQGGELKGEIAGGSLYNEGTVLGLTVKGSGVVDNNGELAGTTTVSDGGRLNVGTGTSFADGANVAVSNNGTFNSANGKFENFSGNVTLSNGANVLTDLSSKTGQTDVFRTGSSGNSATLSPSDGPINVTLSDFNFIPDTLASSGFISKEQLKENMGLTGNNNGTTVPLYELSIQEGVTHEALSPLRWLKAASTPDGILFGPTGDKYKDFNPSVMVGPIAAQIGGYLNQLNSYDEAFRNMDMYMLMTKKERQAMKLRNKYAAANSILAFDPTNTPYDDKAVWIRPYSTFENVPLKGGPKVSNVAYGSYFGLESELYELNNGWDAMYGIYAGYNGSHQTYDGIGIFQNGGTLGLVGMAYKGNFFTGVTVNAGANIGEANTFYGQDNFTLLMAGIANKTGYNWELAEGKFIIQPSLMTSYSFVNTFDYTTSSGINVSSDALHAVTFEPGIKFIGNLKNGWQPYAGVSVVWNILDKTDFQASDATLPELSVKPFVKYGIGIRKTWGERLTGFFQTYFTGGGRNGVGFQLGFRMTLGKGGNGYAKKGSVPALPSAKVRLSERG